MTDGDVILSLLFDNGSIADPTPPFPMGSCGRELYAAVAPLAHADHLHGWPLAHLCEALGRMRQSISDLVRAWEEEGVVAENSSDLVTMQRSGWSRAVHPRYAPGTGSEVDLLPFVGQLAGVRGIAPLADEDRRAAIRRRDGFARGQPEALRAFAGKFVDGEGAVTVRERYDASGDEAPYRGRIVLKRSRLRGLARENLISNPRAHLHPDAANMTVGGSPGMTGVGISVVPCDWQDTPNAFRAVGRQANDATPRALWIAFGGSGTKGLPVYPRLPYTVTGQVRVTDPSADAGGLTWAVTWFGEAGEQLSIARGWPLPDDQAVEGAAQAITFVAPDDAAFAQVRLEQETVTPNDQLSFDLTLVQFEQASQLGEYGDASTPGWRPSGRPHASPSRTPGLTVPEIARALLQRVPAGLDYDVVISDYRDYTEVAARVDGRVPTYDEIAARHGTYDKLLED